MAPSREGGCEARPPDSSEVIADLLRETRALRAAIFARFQIPAADRDDLIQEVLLAFVHKRPLITDPRRWLLVALCIQCRRYLRARGRWSALERELGRRQALSDLDRAPEDRFIEHLDLATALHELSGRQQDLLRLRFARGLSAAEAAASLGYRPASMKRVTNRALQRLRSRLRASEPGRL